MSDRLTPEKLDAIMHDLFKGVPPEDDAPIELTTEQIAMWKERGVMAIGTKIIFTLESKARIKEAFDNDDLSSLNPYELAALRLLRAIEED